MNGEHHTHTDQTCRHWPQQSAQNIIIFICGCRFPFGLSNPLELEIRNFFLCHSYQSHNWFYTRRITSVRFGSRQSSQRMNRAHSYFAAMANGLKYVGVYEIRTKSRFFGKRAKTIQCSCSDQINTGNWNEHDYCKRPIRWCFRNEWHVHHKYGLHIFVQQELVSKLNSANQTHRIDVIIASSIECSRSHTFHSIAMPDAKPAVKCLITLSKSIKLPFRNAMKGKLWK